MDFKNVCVVGAGVMGSGIIKEKPYPQFSIFEIMGKR